MVTTDSIEFWAAETNLFLSLDKNIHDKNIVIEINKIIITKSMWKEKIIKEDDVIEIITAVGGG
jgi:thiamine biosynthesis protein ThiS